LLSVLSLVLLARLGWPVAFQSIVDDSFDTTMTLYPRVDSVVRGAGGSEKIKKQQSVQYRIAR